MWAFARVGVRVFVCAFVHACLPTRMCICAGMQACLCVHLFIPRTNKLAALVLELHESTAFLFGFISPFLLDTKITE